VPATRILLRVYESAAKEFLHSHKSVITIQLGKLTMFAKEFGSVAFQDMPFELKPFDEAEALVIPKVWIPVTNPTVLESLKQQSLELASDLLKKRVSEDSFKARILRIFPEISYFNTTADVYRVQRDQTFGAMLSVYWLITGQHEAFIKEQKHDCQLSQPSWAWIQEWMAQTVKLSTEDAVDATLVFMAIHALGKIKEFRDEMMPGFDAHMHDIALAHILETKPQVVPSFARLDRKYQHLIVDSLSVDFQFSQFLQAEATPANLVVMKEKLKPHGDDGFAFFCFRIFAQMCGKLGSKSLKCSLFMDESQFQRFRPGLDALQQLRTLDAASAYNAFMLLRGSKAMSRFASPEHQALARLLCLGAAYDYQGGDSLCDAFDELGPEERRFLTQLLNQDGITNPPGYVLCDAPGVLQNAKVNRFVGLASALRMLIKVQQKLALEPSSSSAHSNVVVHLGELAAWAKDAGPEHGDFLQATLALRSESQGETRVIRVDVERPGTGQAQPPEEGEVLAPSGSMAWLSSVSVLTATIVLSLTMVVSLCFIEASSAIPGVGQHRGPFVAAFGAVFCLTGGLLARVCYLGRDWFVRAPPSCTEVGPREPFLMFDFIALTPRTRHEYSRLNTDDEEAV